MLSWIMVAMVGSQDGAPARFARRAMPPALKKALARQQRYRNRPPKPCSPITWKYTLCAARPTVVFGTA